MRADAGVKLGDAHADRAHRGRRADDGDVAEAVAELPPTTTSSTPSRSSSQSAASPPTRTGTRSGASTSVTTSTWTCRRRGRAAPAPASRSRVVDTGLAAAHPDLANQLAYNPGEAQRRANGIDDDGNGYVDDWNGWDFVYDDTRRRRTTTATARTSPARSPRSATTTVGVAGVAPEREDHAAARARHQRLRHQHRHRRGVRLRRRWACGSSTPASAAPGLDQTQDAIQAHPNTLYVVAAGNDNVNNDVDADGTLRAARGQHPLRRRVRRERPARLVLELRRDSVDVFAPGPRILSTSSRRRRLRVHAGHVDGGPHVPASPRSCSRPSRARARSRSRARSWRPPRRGPTWPARPSPAGG